TYAIGTRRLLDSVSLSVEPGERIGLVGRNGCGKSTLLKIAAGLIPHDAGQISLGKSNRVGYLRQDPRFETGETLRGEAEAAFAELHRIQHQLHQVFD